jgi:hypothetical protein
MEKHIFQALAVILDFSGYHGDAEVGNPPAKGAYKRLFLCLTQDSATGLVMKHHQY